MKMVGEEPKGRVQVGNTLALRLSSKPGMSFYDYALWFFFCMCQSVYAYSVASVISDSVRPYGL